MNIEKLYLEVVDSTNTYCKELIKNGKHNNFLVVSREQTSGRGRLGRSFYSPKDTGIYMSLALRYEDSFNLVSVTTKTALAVIDALKEFTDKELSIKWVNDIYVDERKVCGILTEGCSNQNSQFIIIGIGINVFSTEFPEELNEIAATLNLDKMSKNLIIDRIINNVEYYLFNECNYIEKYKRYSNCLNKDICYIKNGTNHYGHVIDFTENGELVLVNNEGKTTILNSGEISIKKI